MKRNDEAPGTKKPVKVQISGRAPGSSNDGQHKEKSDG